MSSNKKEVYKNFIRGPSWALAMRWSVHLIGLVSIAVYARVLSPEDFGLIAMGAVAMGLITGITELGVQQLIIREKTITSDDCNTAWTIKIIQGLVVAIFLILVSSYAQNYFDEVRVKNVIIALALFAFITGFENIGMTLARKELDFSKDYRFVVYKRLFRFSVTLVLVLIIRNYWALIYGQILAAFFGVIISFLMHQYRPRFSLVEIKKYLAFSTSIIPIRIGRYLNNTIDIIIVGGSFPTATMGIYNVASQLSGMFTRELEVPLARGLMPNYSKLVNEPNLLAEAFLNVVRAVAIITCAAGFGLAATAPEFIILIMGEKWLSTAPIIFWLSLYGIVAALIHLFNGQIMIALGRERRSAILVWVRVVVFLVAVSIASNYFDLEGISVVVFLSSFVLLPIYIWSVSETLKLRNLQIFASIYRPILAGLVMLFALKSIFIIFENLNTLYIFVLQVFLGAIIYIFTLLVIWGISGRQDGFEKIAVDYALKKCVRVITNIS